MRKILLLTIFTTISCLINAQLKLETTNLAYTYDNGKKCSYTAITGSFQNLRDMLNADMAEFLKTMTKYNYTLDKKSRFYVAPSCIDGDIWTIKKTTGEISVIYSGTNGEVIDDISDLKKWVKRHYPQKIPRITNGFEIYSFLFKENNTSIRLQLYIQEEADGGIVLLKQF